MASQEKPATHRLLRELRSDQASGSRAKGRSYLGPAGKDPHTGKIFFLSQTKKLYKVEMCERLFLTLFWLTNLEKKSMPLSTTYDAAASVIRITGHGPVSMEDRREFINRLCANAEYQENSDILVNVTSVTNAPAGSEFVEISRLVLRLRSRFQGRIAIVNAQAGHITVSHLVALSADLAEEFVRVFTSETEALLWIQER